MIGSCYTSYEGGDVHSLPYRAYDVPQSHSLVEGCSILKAPPSVVDVSSSSTKVCYCDKCRSFFFMSYHPLLIILCSNSYGRAHIATPFSFQELPLQAHPMSVST